MVHLESSLGMELDQEESQLIVRNGFLDFPLPPSPESELKRSKSWPGFLMTADDGVLAFEEEVVSVQEQDVAALNQPSTIERDVAPASQPAMPDEEESTSPSKCQKPSCKPCMWFKRALCKYGDDCDFCHLAHKTSRARKHKRDAEKKRALLNQRADVQDEAAGEEREP
eukprot:TRINITY_DN9987_c0_g1_i3.p2 TRINITY_DN9987_c0_g1~~TRINITY_DN9987_c0_g1_i3.p2  ORF type:complete len:184 (-),score=43.37 TRINITY_DN9987_c0_g1_i3:162-668(-)